MELKANTEKELAHTITAKRRTYFINAGHRGNGTGAMGNGIDEGAEAIWLRDKIVQTLSDYGCIVKKDDDKAQLSAVVKSINTSCKPDDICLDIHFNAAGASATGTECFVREGAKVLEKLIAIELTNKLKSVLGIKNRGVKTDNQGQHSRLAMCSDIRCNAVLVEICFLSNANDAAAYKEKRYEVVQAIVSSLMKNYGI